MEKISGILPSNNRITSVDLKDSQPLRPGHGARFGRDSVVSEVRRHAAPKLTLTDAPNAYGKLSERKMKDRDHAIMVQNMSDSFFGKSRLDEKIPGLEETDFADTNPMGVETDRFTQNEMAAQQALAKINIPDYSEEYIEDESYAPMSDTEMSEVLFVSEPEEQQAFRTVGSNLSVVA